MMRKEFNAGNTVPNLPSKRGGPAQLDRNLVFLSEFSAG